MGSTCLWVVEKEVTHEDNSYAMQLCSQLFFNPTKGQHLDRPNSNQTPDLWLKLQSVQFTAERVRERERGEGAFTQEERGGGRKRIKGLSSLDDVQGLEE